MVRELPVGMAGVIATTLFLYARHLCRQPYEIAAVDATQSMEVVFSLIGEIIFLHGAVPGPLGWAGVDPLWGGR